MDRPGLSGWDSGFYALLQLRLFVANIWLDSTVRVRLSMVGLVRCLDPKTPGPIPRDCRWSILLDLLGKSVGWLPPSFHDLRRIVAQSDFQLSLHTRPILETISIPAPDNRAQLVETSTEAKLPSGSHSGPSPARSARAVEHNVQTPIYSDSPNGIAEVSRASLVQDLGLFPNPNTHSRRIYYVNWTGIPSDSLCIFSLLASTSDVCYLRHGSTAI